MASDDIGERGQNAFYLMMTEFCGRPEPFFRPRFLGDKFPTFDYLVELVDHPSCFFFVSVKATILGYTKQENRLRVQVSQVDIDRMVSYPAPTYLAGVDATTTGLGFLLSVNEARDHVASMAAKHRIDCATLAHLNAEVRDYWSARDMSLKSSRFRE